MKFVPLAVMPKLPTPLMTSWTESGAMPFFLTNEVRVKENLKVVAVVPVEGVTPALMRLTV